MALANNLSFVTVMDISIIDKNILNGGSYTFAFDATTHELPFQATVDSLKLSAAIDGSSTGVTVTTALNSITITKGTTDIVFDLSDGSISITTGDSDPTISFTLTVAEHTVAETVNATTGITDYIKPMATLDTLTISNLTEEGPRKEGRGGKNARPVIRYGKTARLEMEDIVFNGEVLAKFANASVTRDVGGNITSITFTEEFPDGFSIIGDTNVVNKDTGLKENLYLVFYDFLPDGLINLTMEAEGDLGIMNMQGELFSKWDSTANKSVFYVMTDKN